MHIYAYVAQRMRYNRYISADTECLMGITIDKRPSSSSSYEISTSDISFRRDAADTSG